MKIMVKLHRLTDKKSSKIKDDYDDEAFLVCDDEMELFFCDISRNSPTRREIADNQLDAGSAQLGLEVALIGDLANAHIYLTI